MRTLYTIYAQDSVASAERQHATCDLRQPFVSTAPMLEPLPFFVIYTISDNKLDIRRGVNSELTGISNSHEWPAGVMKAEVDMDQRVVSHERDRIPGSIAGMNLSWSAVEALRSLVPDEIHVWRVALDISDARLARLWSILSPDEAARAARYRFPELGRRYVAGRGALRCILARYLDIDPEGVRFEYQARGKPVLANPPIKSSALSFNFSHSHAVGLCAVTLNRLVGVDVEYLHRTVDMASIAERFFAPHECAMLRSVPVTQQRALFFRYWTCKEAFIKATGQGVSQLEEVEVDLRGAEPARLKSGGPWSLYALSPDVDHAGAVVAEGSGHVLRGWQYGPALESGVRMQ